jgi:hypothetical protein
VTKIRSNLRKRGLDIEKDLLRLRSKIAGSDKVS